MKVDDKQWKGVFDRIPKDKLEKMVILFLLGIFFLLVSNPLGNTTKKKTIVNQENEEKKEENMSNDAYIEMLENKLEQTIEGMEGAGRVHVMITLENGGEKILDKNQPYESSMEKVKEDGKESEHSTMQSDSETVLIDLRYISSDMIGQFVEFDEADVLFLYSTMLLNNSLTIK